MDHRSSQAVLDVRSGELGKHLLTLKINQLHVHFLVLHVDEHGVCTSHTVILVDGSDLKHERTGIGFYAEKRAHQLFG